MELMLSCFNCNNQFPDKGNRIFCSKCLTQVKCKKCQTLLEKDDVGCGYCGTPVAETKSGTVAVNNIEFEQKGNSKKFTASFTDHVGENLVASLGGLFLGTSTFKPNTHTNPFTQVKSTQLPTGQPKAEQPAIEYTSFDDMDENELKTALTKIFKTEEDKLILVNQRLKFSGKRDHAIRITLVVLYAYSLIGKSQVKKSTVAEILQSAAVYDNNYLTWLGKCDEIKKLDNDNLELNLPGRDAALEILKEFINPSIEKGNVSFSTISSGGVKKGRSKKAKSEGATTEGPSGKSGSSSKMSPAKMVDILISEKYFDEKKRVPEIIKYCKDIKGQSLDTTTLSTALLRKVKSSILKREQNTADNQYEYYK